MKNIIIGLAICFSLYSSFYYFHCKKINSDKTITKKENLNEDKYTQTENNLISDEKIIKEVLDDIIDNIEKTQKQSKVSFDEGFEVIH